MTTPTLFELDQREPASGPHVLLPNMAYACGGSILTKQGSFTFLTTAENFDSQVGCPDCHAIGYDALLNEQRTQQGRQAAVS